MMHPILPTILKSSQSTMIQDGSTRDPIAHNFFVVTCLQRCLDDVGACQWILLFKEIHTQTQLLGTLCQTLQLLAKLLDGCWNHPIHKALLSIVGCRERGRFYRHNASDP